MEANYKKILFVSTEISGVYAQYPEILVNLF
jgi:hypothetical protein